MRLAFIGGGVMAEAMIKAVLDQGLATPKEVAASDVVAARREALSARYGIATVAENRAALRRAAVVVLAIKPQNLAEVAQDLQGRLGEGQVVLSIVAGANLGRLTSGLGHQAVVRAMPNTPAQIGEGITLWTATAEVTAGQAEACRSILSALGRQVQVPQEKYVDMATAVSGSGPGYIFLVAEALVDGAVHLGLPRDLAQEMVLQTIVGSGKFAQVSGKHLAELRNLVTSPGGTTAEGLLALEEGGVRAAFIQAVIAAYEKTLQLSGEGDEKR